MKTSPLFMGSLYFFMGVVFTYIATQSVEETLFSFTTIILVVVATFDFAVSLRLFAVHFKMKKSKDNKSDDKNE